MALASKIIIIGGSAGAYGLIIEMLESIPTIVAAAIIVVLHRNPKYATQIEKNLSLKLNRDVFLADDKAEIVMNQIYFAPAGYHLLIEPNHTFSLDISDPVNFSRPSIDVLFESAAEVYKKNCTAFLLSGANSDGAYGLKRLEFFGAQTFIQDPDDAIIDTMPNSAIVASEKSQVLTNKQIIDYFCSLK